MCVCVHLLVLDIINNGEGVGVRSTTGNDRKPPPPSPRDFFLDYSFRRRAGHYVEMRATGTTSMNAVATVVVAIWWWCATATLSADAAATDPYRAKRGVVPGNAAYRPKGVYIMILRGPYRGFRIVNK